MEFPRNRLRTMLLKPVAGADFCDPSCQHVSFNELVIDSFKLLIREYHNQQKHSQFVDFELDIKQSIEARRISFRIRGLKQKRSQRNRNLIGLENLRVAALPSAHRAFDLARHIVLKLHIFSDWFQQPPATFCDAVSVVIGVERHMRCSSNELKNPNFQSQHPKLLEIGFTCLYELLSDLSVKDPQLCVKALASLSQLLESLRPAQLLRCGDSFALLYSLFELLKTLLESNHPEVLSLSAFCMIALAVSVGTPDLLLQTASALSYVHDRSTPLSNNGPQEREPTSHSHVNNTTNGNLAPGGRLLNLSTLSPPHASVLIDSTHGGVRHLEDPTSSAASCIIPLPNNFSILYRKVCFEYAAKGSQTIQRNQSSLPETKDWFTQSLARQNHFEFTINVPQADCRHQHRCFTEALHNAPSPSGQGQSGVLHHLQNQEPQLRGTDCVLANRHCSAADEFCALATDSKFLYLLHPVAGLLKMGTGVCETKRGVLYGLNPQFAIIPRTDIEEPSRDPGPSATNDPNSQPNYCSVPENGIVENNWLCAYGSSLYLRTKYSTKLTVVDAETLTCTGEVLLPTATTDGLLCATPTGLSLLRIDDNNRLLVTSLTESFVVSPEPELAVKLSRLRLVHNGSMILARERCLNNQEQKEQPLRGSMDVTLLLSRLPVKIEEHLRQILLGKEIGFLLTNKGTVFYAGRGSYLGLADDFESWSEVHFPEPIVRFNIGHNGAHAVFLSSSGQAYFCGIASRGEDGDTQVLRRNPQPAKCRKMRIPPPAIANQAAGHSGSGSTSAANTHRAIGRSKIISVACNTGSTALVTEGGVLYLFGKDAQACSNQSNNITSGEELHRTSQKQSMGYYTREDTNSSCSSPNSGSSFTNHGGIIGGVLKNVHIASVALGKAHIVAVAQNGSVFTFGMNNVGQCGRQMIVGSISSTASPAKGSAVEQQHQQREPSFRHIEGGRRHSRTKDVRDINVPTSVGPLDSDSDPDRYSSSAATTTTDDDVVSSYSGQIHHTVVSSLLPSSASLFPPKICPSPNYHIWLPHPVREQLHGSRLSSASSSPATPRRVSRMNQQSPLSSPGIQKLPTSSFRCVGCGSTGMPELDPDPHESPNSDRSIMRAYTHDPNIAKQQQHLGRGYHSLPRQTEQPYGEFGTQLFECCAKCRRCRDCVEKAEAHQQDNSEIRYDRNTQPSSPLLRATGPVIGSRSEASSRMSTGIDTTTATTDNDASGIQSDSDSCSVSLGTQLESPRRPPLPPKSQNTSPAAGPPITRPGLAPTPSTPIKCTTTTSSGILQPSRLSFKIFAATKLSKHTSLTTPKISAVACGSYHTMLLSSVADGGQVFTFGSNRYGQLGIGAGRNGDSLKRQVSSNTTSIGGTTSSSFVHMVSLSAGHREPSVQIAAGSNHCLVRTSSGLVYSWGKHHAGQLCRNPPKLPDKRPNQHDGATVCNETAESENSLGAPTESVAQYWYTLPDLVHGFYTPGNNQDGTVEEGPRRVAMWIGACGDISIVRCEQSVLSRSILNGSVATGSARYILIFPGNARSQSDFMTNQDPSCVTNNPHKCSSQDSEPSCFSYVVIDRTTSRAKVFKNKPPSSNDTGAQKCLYDSTRTNTWFSGSSVTLDPLYDMLWTYKCASTILPNDATDILNRVIARSPWLPSPSIHPSISFIRYPEFWLPVVALDVADEMNQHQQQYRSTRGQLQASVAGFRHGASLPARGGESFMGLSCYGSSSLSSGTTVCCSPHQASLFIISTFYVLAMRRLLAETARMNNTRELSSGRLPHIALQSRSLAAPNLALSIPNAVRKPGDHEKGEEFIHNNDYLSVDRFQGFGAGWGYAAAPHTVEAVEFLVERPVSVIGICLFGGPGQYWAKARLMRPFKHNVPDDNGVLGPSFGFVNDALHRDPIHLRRRQLNEPPKLLSDPRLGVIGAAGGLEIVSETREVSFDPSPSDKRDGNNDAVFNRNIADDGAEAPRSWPLFFTAPIVIDPGQWYLIHVTMSGPSSDCGIGGRPTVLANDNSTVFHFQTSRYSNNGTDVYGGQIPSILFRPSHSSQNAIQQPPQLSQLDPRLAQLDPDNRNVPDLIDLGPIIRPGNERRAIPPGNVLQNFIPHQMPDVFKGQPEANLVNMYRDCYYDDNDEWNESSGKPDVTSDPDKDTDDDIDEFSEDNRKQPNVRREFEHDEIHHRLQDPGKVYRAPAATPMAQKPINTPIDSSGGRGFSADAACWADIAAIESEIFAPSEDRICYNRLSNVHDYRSSTAEPASVPRDPTLRTTPMASCLTSVLQIISHATANTLQFSTASGVDDFSTRRLEAMNLISVKLLEIMILIAYPPRNQGNRTFSADLHPALSSDPRYEEHEDTVVLIGECFSMLCSILEMTSTSAAGCIESSTNCDASFGVMPSLTEEVVSSIIRCFHVYFPSPAIAKAALSRLLVSVPSVPSTGVQISNDKQLFSALSQSSGSFGTGEFVRRSSAAQVHRHQQRFNDLLLIAVLRSLSQKRCPVRFLLSPSSSAIRSAPLLVSHMRKCDLVANSSKSHQTLDPNSNGGDSATAGNADGRNDELQSGPGHSKPFDFLTLMPILFQFVFHNYVQPTGTRESLNHTGGNALHNSDNNNNSGSNETDGNFNDNFRTSEQMSERARNSAAHLVSPSGADGKENPSHTVNCDSYCQICATSLASYNTATALQQSASMLARGICAELVALSKQKRNPDGLYLPKTNIECGSDDVGKRGLSSNAYTKDAAVLPVPIISPCRFARTSLGPNWDISGGKALENVAGTTKTAASDGIAFYIDSSNVRLNGIGLYTGPPGASLTYSLELLCSNNDIAAVIQAAVAAAATATTSAGRTQTQQPLTAAGGSDIETNILFPEEIMHKQQWRLITKTSGQLVMPQSTSGALPAKDNLFKDVSRAGTSGVAAAHIRKAVDASAARRKERLQQVQPYAGGGTVRYQQHQLVLGENIAYARFHKPVTLDPGVLYAVRLVVRSRSGADDSLGGSSSIRTWSGENGYPHITCQNPETGATSLRITFTSCAFSSNGTTVNRGQFPYFVFNSTNGENNKPPTVCHTGYNQQTSKMKRTNLTEPGPERPNGIPPSISLALPSLSGDVACGWFLHCLKTISQHVQKFVFSTEHCSYKGLPIASADQLANDKEGNVRKPGHIPHRSQSDVIFSSTIADFLSEIYGLASVFLEANPKYALDILKALDELLPVVCSTNKSLNCGIGPVSTKPSKGKQPKVGNGMEGSQFDALRKTLTVGITSVPASSPPHVVIESEHPYKAGCITSYMVPFPLTTSFLVLEFDPACRTSNASDCLEVFIGTRQAPVTSVESAAGDLIPIAAFSTVTKHNREVDPSQDLGDPWRDRAQQWPSGAIILPGNTLWFVFKSNDDAKKNLAARSHMERSGKGAVFQKPDDEAESMWGFRCVVTGLVSGHDDLRFKQARHQNTGVTPCVATQLYFSQRNQFLRNLECNLTSLSSMACKSLVTLSHVIPVNLWSDMQIQASNPSDFFTTSPASELYTAYPRMPPTSSVTTSIDSSGSSESPEAHREAFTELIREHGTLLRAGLQLERLPTIYELQRCVELPFAKRTSTEAVFLRDFIAASMMTTGGRLARWLMPDPVVDLNVTELLLECDEFERGQPILVTLVTKDQYGRIAFTPEVKVEIVAKSVDSSEHKIDVDVRQRTGDAGNISAVNASMNTQQSQQPSRQGHNMPNTKSNPVESLLTTAKLLITRIPYQPTYLNKARYTSISVMKGYDMYSFEELRWAFSTPVDAYVSRRDKESLSVASSGDGVYCSSWAPVVSGKYIISASLTDCGGCYDVAKSQTVVISDEIQSGGNISGRRKAKQRKIVLLPSASGAATGAYEFTSPKDSSKSASSLQTNERSDVQDQIIEDASSVQGSRATTIINKRHLSRVRMATVLPLLSIASTKTRPVELQSTSGHPSQLRSNTTAGLRVRSAPSLFAEQLGVIPPGAAIFYVDELENEEGVWLRLTDETTVAYCINSGSSTVTNRPGHNPMMSNNGTIASGRGSVGRVSGSDSGAFSMPTNITDHWILHYHRPLNRYLVLRENEDSDRSGAKPAVGAPTAPETTVPGPSTEQEDWQKDSQSPVTSSPRRSNDTMSGSTSWFVVTSCGLSGVEILDRPYQSSNRSASRLTSPTIIKFKARRLGLLSLGDTVEAVRLFSNELGDWIELSGASASKYIAAKNDESCEKKRPESHTGSANRNPQAGKPIAYCRIKDASNQAQYLEPCIQPAEDGSFSELGSNELAAVDGITSPRAIEAIRHVTLARRLKASKESKTSFIQRSDSEAVQAISEQPTLDLTDHSRQIRTQTSPSSDESTAIGSSPKTTQNLPQEPHTGGQRQARPAVSSLDLTDRKHLLQSKLKPTVKVGPATTTASDVTFTGATSSNVDLSREPAQHRNRHPRLSNRAVTSSNETDKTRTNVIVAATPSHADALRSAFAAFMWHEGFVADAIACAAYLKFHPELQCLQFRGQISGGAETSQSASVSTSKVNTTRPTTSQSFRGNVSVNNSATRDGSTSMPQVGTRPFGANTERSAHAKQSRAICTTKNQNATTSSDTVPQNDWRAEFNIPLALKMIHGLWNEISAALNTIIMVQKQSITAPTEQGDILARTKSSVQPDDRALRSPMHNIRSRNISGARNAYENYAADNNNVSRAELMQAAFMPNAPHQGPCLPEIPSFLNTHGRLNDNLIPGPFLKDDVDESGASAGNNIQGPEAHGKHRLEPGQGWCELCDTAVPFPVTSHIKASHPGCGRHAGGQGYNSTGRYTSGWTGNCNEYGSSGLSAAGISSHGQGSQVAASVVGFPSFALGIGGPGIAHSGGPSASSSSSSSWFLLCSSCRQKYLHRKASQHKVKQASKNRNHPQASDGKPQRGWYMEDFLRSPAILSRLAHFKATEQLDESPGVGICNSSFYSGNSDAVGYYESPERVLLQNALFLLELNSRYEQSVKTSIFYDRRCLGQQVQRHRYDQTDYQLMSQHPAPGEELRSADIGTLSYEAGTRKRSTHDKSFTTPPTGAPGLSTQAENNGNGAWSVNLYPQTINSPASKSSWSTSPPSSSSMSQTTSFGHRSNESVLNNSAGGGYSATPSTRHRQNPTTSLMNRGTSRSKVSTNDQDTARENLSPSIVLRTPTKKQRSIETGQFSGVAMRTILSTDTADGSFLIAEAVASSDSGVKRLSQSSPNEVLRGESSGNQPYQSSIAEQSSVILKERKRSVGTKSAPYDVVPPSRLPPQIPGSASSGDCVDTANVQQNLISNPSLALQTTYGTLDADRLKPRVSNNISGYNTASVEQHCVSGATDDTMSKPSDSQLYATIHQRQTVKFLVKWHNLPYYRFAMVASIVKCVTASHAFQVLQWLLKQATLETARYDIITAFIEALTSSRCESLGFDYPGNIHNPQEFGENNPDSITNDLRSIFPMSHPLTVNVLAGSNAWPMLGHFHSVLHTIGSILATSADSKVGVGKQPHGSSAIALSSEMKRLCLRAWLFDFTVYDHSLILGSRILQTLSRILSDASNTNANRLDKGPGNGRQTHLIEHHDIDSHNIGMEHCKSDTKYPSVQYLDDITETFIGKIQASSRQVMLPALTDGKLDTFWESASSLNDEAPRPYRRKKEQKSEQQSSNVKWLFVPFSKAKATPLIAVVYVDNLKDSLQRISSVIFSTLTPTLRGNRGRPGGQVEVDISTQGSSRSVLTAKSLSARYAGWVDCIVPSNASNILIEIIPQENHPPAALNNPNPAACVRVRNMSVVGFFSHDKWLRRPSNERQLSDTTHPGQPALYRQSSSYYLQFNAIQEDAFALFQQITKEAFHHHSVEESHSGEEFRLRNTLLDVAFSREHWHSIQQVVVRQMMSALDKEASHLRSGSKQNVSYVNGLLTLMSRIISSPSQVTRSMIMARRTLMTSLADIILITSSQQIHNATLGLAAKLTSLVNPQQARATVFLNRLLIILAKCLMVQVKVLTKRHGTLSMTAATALNSASKASIGLQDTKHTSCTTYDIDWNLDQACSLEVAMRIIRFFHRLAGSSKPTPSLTSLKTISVPDNNDTSPSSTVPTDVPDTTTPEKGWMQFVRSLVVSHIIGVVFQGVASAATTDSVPSAAQGASSAAAGSAKHGNEGADGSAPGQIASHWMEQKSLWMCLASLAVLQDDSWMDISPLWKKLTGSEEKRSTESISVRPKSPPPFCENHDDGETRAIVRCDACGGLALCRECNSVFHMSRRNRSHKIQLLVSPETVTGMGDSGPRTSTQAVTIHASEDCSRLKLPWLLVLTDVKSLNVIVEFRNESTSLGVGSLGETQQPGRNQLFTAEQVSELLEAMSFQTDDTSNVGFGKGTPGNKHLTQLDPRQARNSKNKDIKSKIVTRCRFCSRRIPPIDILHNTTMNRDEVTIPVCDSGECLAFVPSACARLLGCGHLCGGIRNEEQCLPCLQCALKTDPSHRENPSSNQLQLRQDAEDMCVICFTDTLGAAPAIQLTSCGHVFHVDCVRRVLERRWPGPRISFTFMQCPICKVRISHPSLINGASGQLHGGADHALPESPRQRLESTSNADAVAIGDENLLADLNALYDDVCRKAVMRLEYEGLKAAPCITADKNSGYFGDHVAYALDKYAYYVCFKCNRAYYGGEAVCAAAIVPSSSAPSRQRQGRELKHSTEYDPSELVCGGCSDVAQAQVCPRHATDYLEYKCRYCCSIAVFFCFGTTHFCASCHDDFQRITSLPRHMLPCCPVAPGCVSLNQDQATTSPRLPIQPKGKGKGKSTANNPNMCPLRISHPPTGEEFSLGCGICRNVASF